MIVGIPREIAPGERRVALAPDSIRQLSDTGLEFVLEAGAGQAAGFEDSAYTELGARVEASAEAVLGADLVLKVQPPRERPDGGHEVDALRSGATLISFLRPLDQPELASRLAERGVTAMALELVPRITRAQSMDALSSQANLAGYRAVVLAADRLPKMFPMMVTAAGTVSPARVFVIGAGVAGLQAIATAKRLGAVVEAYDTRPAVAEQVQSLGGKFVELQLETGDAEDAGGYAREQSEEFYARQRELMAKVAGNSDVVVTTALVPGRRAPLLIDEAGVRGMKRGAVIVDLAADNGGNCAFVEAGREVEVDGVTLIGAGNLASDLPSDASRLLGKNFQTLLKHLIADGALDLDLEDEITAGMTVCHEGKVIHEMVLGRLGGGEA